MAREQYFADHDHPDSFFLISNGVQDDRMWPGDEKEKKVLIIAKHKSRRGRWNRHKPDPVKKRSILSLLIKNTDKGFQKTNFMLLFFQGSYT